jgi:hypothetical protein
LEVRMFLGGMCVLYQKCAFLFKCFRKNIMFEMRVSTLCHLTVVLGTRCCCSSM